MHRWGKLATLRAEIEDDGAEKEAADELINFLTPITASAVDHLAKTRETEKVTFEYIWQILPPGELAVTKLYGVDAVCRVVKYENSDIGGVPVWIIHLEYVDWNGETCGFATTKAIISAFNGFRRVTALPVYPLSFEKNVAEIRQKMVYRGRKFENYRGYHFLTCSGKKILIETSEERTVRDNIFLFLKTALTLNRSQAELLSMPLRITRVIIFLSHPFDHSLTKRAPPSRLGPRKTYTPTAIRTRIQVIQGSWLMVMS